MDYIFATRESRIFSDSIIEFSEVTDEIEFNAAIEFLSGFSSEFIENYPVFDLTKYLKRVKTGGEVNLAMEKQIGEILRKYLKNIGLKESVQYIYK